MRRLYGASTADFTFDGDKAAPSVRLAVALGPSAPARVTLGLESYTGGSVTEVRSDAYGEIRFYGTNLPSDLWLTTIANDGSLGSVWYVVRAADLGTQVDSFTNTAANTQAALADVQQQVATLKQQLAAFAQGGAGTGTTPAGDTTKPSTPSGVSASATSATTAALSHNGSTDNLAVTGYRYYLNGAQVGGDQPATSRSQTFTGLTASTSYTLAVGAFDAAGNVSVLATASVTTSAAASGVTYDANGFTAGPVTFAGGSTAYQDGASVSASVVVSYDPTRTAATSLDDIGLSVREVNPSTNAVISADDATLDFPHVGAISTSAWTNKQRTITAAATFAGPTSSSAAARKYAVQVFYKVTGQGTYPRLGTPTYFTVAYVAPATPTTPVVTTPANSKIPAVPAGKGWFSGGSGDGIDSSLDGTTTAFGAWRGRNIECVATWNDGADGSGWAFSQINTGGPAYFKGLVDIAIGGPSSWSAAAGGSLDAALRAGLTKARGFRVIGGTRYPLSMRPFHEWNGNYAWAVDPSELSAFRATQARWRNIQADVYPEAIWSFNTNGESFGVTSFAWTQGFVDTFVFTGTTNAYYTNGQTYPCYDAYSTDRYNQFPFVATVADWNSAINLKDGNGAPKGLEAHRLFAQSKGLPMLLPEWASNGDNGDSPVYMQQFYAWLTAHGGTGAGNVLAEFFFNQNKENDRWRIFNGGKQPNAAAAYRAAW